MACPFQSCSSLPSEIYLDARPLKRGQPQPVPTWSSRRLKQRCDGSHRLLFYRRLRIIRSGNASPLDGKPSVGTGGGGVLTPAPGSSSPAAPAKGEEETGDETDAPQVSDASFCRAHRRRDKRTFTCNKAASPLSASESGWPCFFVF